MSYLSIIRPQINYYRKLLSIKTMVFFLRGGLAQRAMLVNGLYTYTRCYVLSQLERVRAKTKPKTKKQNREAQAHLKPTTKKIKIKNILLAR